MPCWHSTDWMYINKQNQKKKETNRDEGVTKRQLKKKKIEQNTDTFKKRIQREREKERQKCCWSEHNYPFFFLAWAEFIEIYIHHTLKCFVYTKKLEKF